MTTIKLTADSTYSIGDSDDPSTLVDEDGDPIDLGDADVTYALTTKEGAGETVVTVDDNDSEWTTEDAEAGEFSIELEPEDTPDGGDNPYYEEFRVDIDGSSIVAEIDGEPQRRVRFRRVATEP